LNVDPTTGLREMKSSMPLNGIRKKFEQVGRRIENGRRNFINMIPKIILPPN
jgi:hypothetical protein